MSFTKLFLIAVGLSMDAFAVAMCKGLNMKKLNYRHGAVIALFFGLFQGGMPLLGWAVGISFEKYVVRVDHWIAFVLLAFIGGKMIFEALKGEEEECCGDGDKLDLKDLVVMAVATSIDALAVGISFAFLKIEIIPAVSLIGVTTFILSFIGVIIGNNFGTRFKEKAELLGGVILIFIGLKILLEHLGIMA